MPSKPIATTPKPPYYAVIFTSLRSEADKTYTLLAEKMESLAAQQPGFLGIESVRNAEGVGITVSYWESPAAILKWREQTDHQMAQRAGKKLWYSDYMLRISKVERDYGKTPHA
jgi:heme-degrading monooxygenase HmoA